MPKRMSLLLKAFAVLVLILAACSDKKAEEGRETGGSTAVVADKPSASAEGTASAQADPEQYYKKYDPPITFTINRLAAEGKTVKDDNPFDIPWSDWDRKESGIIWKAKWDGVSEADLLEKLKLGIASNDLPDVMTGLDAETIAKLVSAGQLLPLNDLIEQYASPLVKFLLQEYDQANQGTGLKAVTFDGKIYALPMLLDGISSNFNTAWLRQDLLDDLGVKLPATVDELENVFKAYKAAYPDGVAFTMDKDLSGIEFALSPYGAVMGRWLKDANGNLVYSSIQPGVKEGLATLRKWYKEGYLDKEFIVKDWGKSIEAFTKNNALILGNGAFWNPFYPFPDMNKEKADIEFSPLPYLQGPAGNALGQVMENPLQYPTAINVRNEHPEALFYELNLAVDSQYRNYADLREQFAFKYPETPYREPLNPEEVQEGKMALYDYPEQLTGPSDFFNRITPTNVPMGFGFQFRAGLEMGVFNKVSEALANNQPLDSLDAGTRNFYAYRSQAMGSQPKAIEAMTKQMVLRKANIADGLVSYSGFMGAPTPTMQSKSAYLKKLEMQTFMDIIVGNAPLEQFDAFVDQWHKQGGEQITKEVNEVK